jgi:23S rRNA pseudouridine2605 synthase
MSEPTIRLQKYLAERGVDSRRHCARIIEEGRVAVDGKVVTEPGFRVAPEGAAVSIDGKPVDASRPRPRTLVLYKPRGYICSRSGEQGKTVFELLPPGSDTLVPVGRLDKDSEGLLLLSSDGELVLRLTHPRFGHRKVYEVSVSGNLTPDVLHLLRSPLVIEGHTTSPADVKVVAERRDVGRTKLLISLREGRNRQIRHMCEQAGLRIHRLARVRVGELTLAGLRPGEWRELDARDLGRLAKG